MQKWQPRLPSLAESNVSLLPREFWSCMWWAFPYHHQQHGPQHHNQSHRMPAPVAWRGHSGWEERLTAVHLWHVGKQLLLVIPNPPFWWVGEKLVTIVNPTTERSCVTVGGGDSLMALTFSSFGCIPTSSTTCPRYSMLEQRKRHFCLLTRILQALYDPN